MNGREGAARYCYSCGAEVEPGDNYCEYCGAKVEAWKHPPRLGTLGTPQQDYTEHGPAASRDDGFPGGTEGDSREVLEEEQSGRRFLSVAAKLIKLTCPSCGAKLEISQDSSQFLCAHCGSQYALSRGAGVVEIKPIIERLDDISTATSESAVQTSRVALELELNRLERELERLRKVEAEFKSYVWKVAGSVGLLVGALVGGAARSSDLFWGVLLVVGGGCYVFMQATQGETIRGEVSRRVFRIAEIRVQLEG